MQQTKQKMMLQGFKDAFPVMLGFIPFGFVLGAQAVAQHMKVWQVPLMTGVNFAGGSEFAAVGRIMGFTAAIITDCNGDLIDQLSSYFNECRTHALFERHLLAKITAGAVLYVR